ncbi:MAG: type II toxin-antitoxin system RelE/ParE family toxin [Chlorobium sp.]
MNYELEYFNLRIKEEINRWPKSTLADYKRLAGLLIEFGPNMRMPHSKAIGRGLFELRARGKDGIGRVFYCYMRDKRIVILHAFIKKTQTTPQRELDIAYKRMNEVK